MSDDPKLTGKQLERIILDARRQEKLDEAEAMSEEELDRLVKESGLTEEDRQQALARDRQRFEAARARQVGKRAESRDLSVARPAINELAGLPDSYAEEALWAALASGNHRKLTCSALLRRRGNAELAERVLERDLPDTDETGVWVQALAALDDERAVGLLAKAVRAAADVLAPPWPALTVGLHAIARLGGNASAGILGGIIREYAGVIAPDGRRGTRHPRSGGRFDMARAAQRRGGGLRDARRTREAAPRPPRAACRGRVRSRQARPEGM